MSKGPSGEQGYHDAVLADILALPALELSGQMAGRYIETSHILQLFQRYHERKTPKLDLSAILALTSVVPLLLNCKVAGDDSVLSKDAVINTIANEVAALTGAEKKQ